MSFEELLMVFFSAQNSCLHCLNDSGRQKQSINGQIATFSDSTGDAFTAFNFSTTYLERIGKMNDSNFPTNEVEQSKDVHEAESAVKYEMPEMERELSGIKEATGI
jgi:hypothetical protein